MKVSKIKNGFTLVELLVVISIIALLLAVLMPSLQKARQQAQRISCSARLKQLSLGMAIYAYDNKGNLPESGRSHFLSLWLPSVLDTFCGYAGVKVDTGVDPLTLTSDELNARYSKLFSCPSRKGDFYISNGYINVHYDLATYGYAYHNYSNDCYKAWTVEPPRKIDQTKPLGRKAGDSATRPLSRKMLSDFTTFRDRMPSYWYGNHIQLTYGTLEDKSKLKGGGNAAFLDGHIEWTPINRMQARQEVRGYNYHFY